MSIPDHFLDTLKSRVKISEVIGPHVKLQRAGGTGEYKGLCPFHNEKTPSFTVSDRKGFYYCFGCGAKGNAIGFLMEHNRMPFREAVETLATSQGMTIPAESPQEKRARAQKATYTEVMAMAADWYTAQLHRDYRARDYLLQRGLRPETIQTFQLGYAPDDGRAFLDHMRAQRVDDDTLITLGLARRYEGSGKVVAFFRGRILFPVWSTRGDVVAFGGRILQGDGPKYINSPDTPLYDKGRMIYAHPDTRMQITAATPPVVVEGYMDVIALHQAGITQGVAPLGTALTEDQIKHLWAMDDTATPLLCFDGDAAGYRAARRAMERIFPLLTPGKSAKIAFLPEGEDPDSLIRRQGVGVMREVLDRAITLDKALWTMTAQDRPLDTPEEKARFKTALLETVQTIANRDVAALYRKTLLEQYSATFFPKRAPGKSRKGQAPVSDALPLSPVRQRFFIEEFLLNLLREPALIEQYCEDLNALDINDERLDTLRHRILDLHVQEAKLSREDVLTMLRETGLQKTAFRLAHLVRQDQADPPAQLQASCDLILQKLFTQQARQDFSRQQDEASPDQHFEYARLKKDLALQIQTE